MAGMVETMVSWGWTTVALYAIAGGLFAIPFLAVWAGRMDATAKAGSLGFRAAILPATVALWPLLAWRVLRGSGSPTDVEWPLRPATQRRLHGFVFLIIAVVVPLVGGLALWSRPNPSPSRVDLDFPPLAGPTTNVTATALPLRAEVVTGRTIRQLQLDVTKPLADPVVAVYWSPAAAPDGVGPDAVFLGSIWGPARFTFPLPVSSVPGVLTFLALSGDQRVVEILNLR
jgi:hypothetical protein